MAEPDVDVRAVRTAEDWRAVRELCCRTGDAGNPIEASRWAFFAELWVGPYQRVVPEWTLVADRGGEVVGYLTGCPDTAAFRRDCALSVTLPLLGRIARGEFGWSRDTRRFVRRTLRLTRGPEARLSHRLPAATWRAYPAHLHMNVDARLRGQGVGRRLVERYLAALAAERRPGVHLFCGAMARGFYLQLGFEELARLEFRPDVRVYALGRRVEASEST